MTSTPFTLRTLSPTRRPAKSAGPDSVTRDMNIPSSSPLNGVEPLPPAIERPRPARDRSIWISYFSSRSSTVASDSPAANKKRILIRSYRSYVIKYSVFTSLHISKTTLSYIEYQNKTKTALYDMSGKWQQFVFSCLFVVIGYVIKLIYFLLGVFCNFFSSVIGLSLQKG